MKKKLAILFLGVLLLFGCANVDEITFEGENDTWKVLLTVNQINGVEDYQIDITYIGEEEFETFYYEVESPKWSIKFGDSYAKLNSEGVYFRDAFDSNRRITDRDSEFDIKIEWNNNSESFSLKHKK